MIATLTSYINLFLQKKTLHKSGSQYCIEGLSLGLPEYLGSFSTNYIIFRNAEIFKKKKHNFLKKFFCEQEIKNLLKYSGFFFFNFGN
jgi:hypothetical protein